MYFFLVFVWYTVVSICFDIPLLFLIFSSVSQIIKELCSSSFYSFYFRHQSFIGITKEAFFSEYHQLTFFFVGYYLEASSSLHAFKNYLFISCFLWPVLYRLITLNLNILWSSSLKRKSYLPSRKVLIKTEPQLELINLRVIRELIQLQNLLTNARF